MGLYSPPPACFPHPHPLVYLPARSSGSQELPSWWSEPSTKPPSKGSGYCIPWSQQLQALLRAEGQSPPPAGSLASRRVSACPASLHPMSSEGAPSWGWAPI